MHLAERPGAPATSEHLAACVGTNAVVVRRTLAGLREAGLVASTPGHGGGWTLARAADALTLGDVYAALGERLLTVGVDGADADCRVERAVAGTLHEFLDDAEALLTARLRGITLADVVAGLGESPHASAEPARAV